MLDSILQESRGAPASAEEQDRINRLLYDTNTRVFLRGREETLLYIHPERRTEMLETQAESVAGELRQYTQGEAKLLEYKEAHAVSEMIRGLVEQHALAGDIGDSSDPHAPVNLIITRGELYDFAVAAIAHVTWLRKQKGRSSGSTEPPQGLAPS